MAVNDMLHAVAELPEITHSEGISDNSSGWQMIGVSAVASFLYYVDKAHDVGSRIANAMHQINNPALYRERIDDDF